MEFKLPRKLCAFLLTDAFLVGGAFLVKNGNFSALATALVGSMTAFIAAHSVMDFKGNSPPPDPKKEDAD